MYTNAHAWSCTHVPIHICKQYTCTHAQTHANIDTHTPTHTFPTPSPYTVLVFHLLLLRQNKVDSPCTDEETPQIAGPHTMCSRQKRIAMLDWQAVADWNYQNIGNILKFD